MCWLLKNKLVLQYSCRVKYRKPPDILRNNQKTIGRRIKNHDLTNTTIALIGQTKTRVSLSVSTVIPPWYGPKNQKSRAAVGIFQLLLVLMPCIHMYAYEITKFQGMYSMTYANSFGTRLTKCPKKVSTQFMHTTRPISEGENHIPKICL